MIFAVGVVSPAVITDAFGELDYKRFFTDNNAYYIRPVYRENGGNRTFNLFIDTVGNGPVLKLFSAEIAVSNLVQNLTFDETAQVIQTKNLHSVIIRVLII